MQTKLNVKTFTRSSIGSSHCGILGVQRHNLPDKPLIHIQLSEIPISLPPSGLKSLLQIHKGSVQLLLLCFVSLMIYLISHTFICFCSNLIAMYEPRTRGTHLLRFPILNHLIYAAKMHVPIPLILKI